jgi:predicted RNase H-like HicB family nuclease
MHVHEEVLAAANQIVAERADGIFGVDEIVRALPHLNENSVRTHVVSRCCVNAPANHLHRWLYFRRVARGRYRVEAAYRRKPKHAARGHRTPSSAVPSHRRDTIHAIIQRDDPFYVAECLEVAVVTQGKTLDEVVENLRQALALHLEDEDMASLGLADRPRVQLIYDTAIAS